MENKYKVYYLQNTVNGKVYFGCTGQELHDRWQNGTGYINNSALYADICKYGWDKFDRGIVVCNLTKTSALETEAALIKWSKAADPEIGYNNSGPHARSKRGASPKLKLMCVETGQTFCGLRAASEFANVSSNDIYGAAGSKTRTAGGYHWEIERN